MKPAPPVNTAGFAILLISLLTTLECGSAARALPRSVEFQSHNRTQIDGSVSSTAEFPDLHSGASFARRRTVKPPTYNVPLDDLIRKGNEWIYRDSPLNVIPISRAPPPTFGQVTPRPRVWHRREAFYAIKTNLNFVFHGPSNYILQEATNRYRGLMATCGKLSTHPNHDIAEADLIQLAMNHSRLTLDPGLLWGRSAHTMEARFLNASSSCPRAQSSKSIDCVQVAIRSLGDDWPSAEMDESYSILVTPSNVKITSNEVWGVLRAFETLSQLIWCSPSGNLAFINQTFIEDFPSFPHRGLHLDTARHYMSKRIILLNLEAMAFNKLNVFHWHLSDDQSFPFESRTFPELSQKAAYHPRMIYTHDDVREILEFARLRGIRVIPEFDLPGHTRSWGKSHPELLAKCYENGQETPHYGGLDPTKQETLDFLSALFEEIVGLFPDAVVHMGFDEVEFACWQSNPFIKQYMIANRFPTSFDLLDSFTTRLLDRVQKAAKRVSRGGQRSFIFWQDAFDSGLNLPNNTIIHLWKNIYARPVYFGHKVIISAGWYLDLVEYSVGWVSLYTSEFFMDRFSSFHSDHKVIDVIGGEACMWAEWQSDETVLQRIWPMTSAVAERLWYHGTPNVDEFAKRLAEQHCRLLRRGIPASVVNGPGMCPLPLDAAVLGQGTFSGLAVTAGIRVPRCLELGSTTALLSLGLLAFLTGLLLGALGILTRISQAIILLSDSVASRFKERRFAQRLVACSVVLATFLFLLLFHTDTRAGTI